MSREENYNEIVKQLVNKGTKSIKEFNISLNNNKPLFQKEDYEIVEGEPIYFEKDEYGRSTGAMALISRNTIPLVINTKKLT